MSEIYFRFRRHLIRFDQDNKGVASVEVILILVVLIGLVIIFKSQAVSLVNKIWDAITENSGSITG